MISPCPVCQSNKFHSRVNDLSKCNYVKLFFSRVAKYKIYNNLRKHKHHFIQVITSLPNGHLDLRQCTTENFMKVDGHSIIEQTDTALTY